MKIKRVVGLILILISGIFGWTNTITGAVIGESSAISWLVVLMFIIGLVLVLIARGEEGKLAKIAAEAKNLLRSSDIGKYNNLISIATKMGYRLEEGKNHVNVYNRKDLITTIPRHREINQYTAKGIVRQMIESYSA